MKTPSALWVVVFLALAFDTGAATKTYTGGNNGRWVVGGNWSGGTTPGTADALRFNNAVESAVAQNWVVDSLSFTGGAAVTHGILANSSTPYDTRTITLNATNNNANGSAAAISVVGGGSLRVGGSTDRGIVVISLGGPGTSFGFEVGTGSTLIFEAGRSQIAGANKSLTMTGPGTLTLGEANTFGGVGSSFTLNSGTVNLNDAAALGNANNSFVINGGVLNNTSGATLTMGNYQQQWNGNFGFTGTTNLHLGSGAVTLGGDRTVTVSANTLTVGGGIGDGGNDYDLNKAGNGTLRLNGVNTHSGATRVQAGTLQLGASASVAASKNIDVAAGATFNIILVTGEFDLADGQTLSGKGTVVGNLSAQAGSIVAPGSSPGILTVDNLTLAGGSTSRFEIVGLNTAGTDFDQLKSGGGNDTVTFESGAVVEVQFLNDSSSPLSGTVKLLDFAGYSGPAPTIQLFNSAADSTSYNEATGEFTFANAYAIPEPGTVVLLGVGLALGCMRRIGSRGRKG